MAQRSGSHSRQDDGSLLLTSTPPSLPPSSSLTLFALYARLVNAQAQINARGIQNLLRLADDLHVISRDAHAGGDFFGVLPIFACKRDGSNFHAKFRVWPCYGLPFRRAGAEWNYSNHISVFELKSVGQRVFTNKKLTDRIRQIFEDELGFARCPLTHCHADEFQARLAIGYRGT